MAKRMEADEFLPFAPSGVGKTRHNHSSPDCAGGRDSMMIERKSDGTTTAYCFRCGASGYNGGSVYRKSSSEIRSSIGDSGSGTGYGGGIIKPESGGVTGWKAFPAQVRSWLFTAGVSTLPLCDVMEWHDKDNALYIPVDKIGNRVGWARRTFSPKSYRPCPTVGMSEFYAHYHSSTECTSVVLTEDLLSAYRVFTDTDHDSISLMGTEIKDSVIRAVIDNKYTLVYVFLDGDNPIVRMKARQIAKRFPFLRTRIIEDGRDPKHHTPGELRCLLT